MISFKCTIDNNVVPFDRLSIRSGAFGSIGSLTVNTSISLLRGQVTQTPALYPQTSNVDLFTIAAQAPAGVQVIVTVQFDQGMPQIIFGGELVTTEWEYDQDVIVIHARDYAGILADQRRIPAGAATVAEKLLAPLAPGQNPNAAPLSTQNQQISQVVTSICGQFGLTPVLNLSNGNPDIGTIYGGTDTIWMATPRTLWGLLNQLARDTGYDVYVTPQRKLVFGTPGVGTTPIKLSYNVSLPQPGAIPCRMPKFKHNVRRNSTFRVLVMSYDQAKGALTLGRATTIGTNLSAVGGLKAGVWSGQAAVTADAELNSLGSSNTYNQLYTYSVGRNYVPLYTFHVDGLTQDQADTRAASIATDISKREVTFSAEIDGFPDVIPTQSVTISGGIEDDFAQRTYYLYGYEHEFTMPRESATDGGFLTTLMCVTTPIFGEGSPLQNPTSA